MQHNASRPWIVRPRPCAAPRLRLLCAPYAGGGASLFRSWPDRLPPDAEVLAVQLPGREKRLAEPPCTDLGYAVARIFRELLPLLDRPLALFGYSMGTRIAYELARTMRLRAGTEPLHLFVAACSAPHVPESSPPRYDLPDDAFKEALQRLGGTPPEVLENAELMDLFLPMIRADFALKEGYVHRPWPPLACPVTAYGGLGDAEAPEAAMRAWQASSRGRFRLRLFAGGHFFLHDRESELLEDISQTLAAPHAVLPADLPRTAPTKRT